MANNLYEKTDVWDNYEAQNILKYRLPLLESMIPDGINDIIDVGCGNGIITNVLSKKYDVTGVDSSEKALKFIEGKSVQSQINSISLPDKCADLVLCSEVLEHLPSEVLYKGVEELIRISKKYILISVPNQELLKAYFVECSNCGHKFHATEHVNSFTSKKLANLFEPSCNVISVKEGGPLVRKYNSTLLHIKQNVGGVYYTPESGIMLCDSCGNTKPSDAKSNIISKATNLLNRAVSSKKPYWLFCLFEKK